MDDFEEWLCTKLKALNTDQDVFSSYIRGILEGDETNDDKLEALEGILAEMQTDSNLTLSQEIIAKWDSLSLAQNADGNVQEKFDVDAQLASIMEKQAQSVVTERKVTEEERKYREAILAQYSHVSDGEDSDASNEKESKDLSSTAVAAAAAAAPVANNDPLLPRNTNVEDVFRAEKEKRDKAKAEFEKKKAVDKANKEKQKQQQQERKEKEKKRTQKGERKR